MLKGVSMELRVGRGKEGEVDDGDGSRKTVIGNFISTVGKGVVGGRDGSEAVGFGQIFDAGDFGRKRLVRSSGWSHGKMEMTELVDVEEKRELASDEWRSGL